MEMIRALLFSSALLILIGVNGLIYTGKFIDISVLFSNYFLIVLGLLMLIFAVYLLIRFETKFQLKKLFVERSDEATLFFVRNELRELKKYLAGVKKINKKNSNKVLKEVKSKLEKLVPYKVYLSSIFSEGNFIENMNKILSYNKITSNNLSEFAIVINKIKEDLLDFS